MKYRAFLFVAAICLITSWGMTQDAPDTKPRYSMEVIGDAPKNLLVLIPGSREEAYRYSNAARHFMYATKQGDGKGCVTAYVDGVAQGSLDALRDTAFLTEDGKHWYFVGDEGSKRVAIISGMRTPPCQNIYGIKASVDGRRAGYVGVFDGSARLVVDGVTLGEYQEITKWDFFSKSNKVVVLAKKDGRHVLAVEGKEDVRVHEPFVFELSPHNLRFALTVKLKNGRAQKWVDGEPGPEFDFEESKLGEQTVFRTVWTSDGLHYTYEAKIGKSYRIVADDVLWPWESAELNRWGELNNFELVGRIRELNLAEGVGIAYVGHSSNGKKFIAFNGMRGPDFDELKSDDVVLSSDGSRVAYKAKIGQARVVVVDGRPSAKYEAARSLVFNTDGNGYAYVAKLHGKWFAVVNGIPSTRQHDDIHEVWFTDNGKHHCYIAKDKGENQLVLDGELCGAPFSYSKSVSLAFSKDDEHICHPASKAGRECLVVDGTEVAALEPGSSIWEFGFKGPAADAWYLENADGGYRVVCVGGETGPYYDDIRSLRFGHRSGKASYTTEDDETQKAKTVVKGVEGPEFKIVGGLVATADNEHIAYRGFEEHRCVTIVDGELGPWLDKVIAHHNSHFGFDENGDVIYFGIVEGKLVRIIHPSQNTP